MNKFKTILLSCSALACYAHADITVNYYALGGLGGSVGIGANTVVLSGAQSIGGQTTFTGANSASILQIGYWAIQTQNSLGVSKPSVKTQASIGVRIENQIAFVDFQLEKSTLVSIQVLNAAGKTIQKYGNVTLPAGANTQQLQLSQLPAQAQFIVIQAGSQRQVLQYHNP